jgi:hypothetical protein
MRIRLALALALASGLAVPAPAEDAPECRALVAVLQDLSGYAVTAPPAAPDDVWCVLDGARLTPTRGPELAAKRLRVSGRLKDGALEVVTVDAGGLQLLSKAGAAKPPDWLGSATRLQTADLSLSLYRNEAEDLLEVRSFMLTFSGGSRIEIDARIRGAGLSAASILTGSLTELRLRWRSDGRILRPAMEAAGLAMGDAAEGAAPVDAARAALLEIVGNLPDEILFEDAAKELARFLRALPQGRGRLVLSLTSDGIGAAELGLLALADDPTGPEALARLLAGSVLTVDWLPGLVD